VGVITGPGTEAWGAGGYGYTHNFDFRGVRGRNQSGEYRIFYSYRKRIDEDRDERGRNQGAKKGGGWSGAPAPRGNGVRRRTRTPISEG